MKNKTIFKHVSFYLILFSLSALRAVSAYIFIIPNNFTVGGINGLAIIINNIVGRFNVGLASTIFNPGIFAFIMNIPLLIVAAVKLNKKFAFNTLLTVASYALVLWLFEFISIPQFLVGDPNSVQMFLAAIVGGLLTGVSLGFSLTFLISAGGTEIISKLVYEKNPKINVQWLILIFDSVTILLAAIIGIFYIEEGMDPSIAFVFVLSPVLFSTVNTFVTSKTADVVLSGIQASVVFNIITTKPHEISEYVVKTLNRSTTILKGEGYYTHENKHIVIVVASRRQHVSLKKSILSIDPHAFMYVTSAKEVNGFGFKK